MCGQAGFSGGDLTALIILYTLRSLLSFPQHAVTTSPCRPTLSVFKNKHVCHAYGETASRRFKEQHGPFILSAAYFYFWFRETTLAILWRSARRGNNPLVLKLSARIITASKRHPPPPPAFLGPPVFNLRLIFSTQSPRNALFVLILVLQV
jgi:hypothetical protein